MAEHHDGHKWAARSTTIHAQRARETATAHSGCCGACVCEPSCAGSHHHYTRAPARGSSTDTAGTHREPAEVRASRRASRRGRRSEHAPADRPRPPPPQVNSGERLREFSESGGLLEQVSYLCTRCAHCSPSLAAHPTPRFTRTSQSYALPAPAPARPLARCALSALARAPRPKSPRVSAHSYRSRRTVVPSD